MRNGFCEEERGLEVVAVVVAVAVAVAVVGAARSAAGAPAGRPARNGPGLDAAAAAAPTPPSPRPDRRAEGRGSTWSRDRQPAGARLLGGAVAGDRADARMSREHCREREREREVTEW